MKSSVGGGSFVVRLWRLESSLYPRTSAKRGTDEIHSAPPPPESASCTGDILLGFFFVKWRCISQELLQVILSRHLFDVPVS